jgi:hypothetical protein
MLDVSVLGMAHEDDTNTWTAAHRSSKMCEDPSDVTLKHTRRRRGRQKQLTLKQFLKRQPHVYFKSIVQCYTYCIVFCVAVCNVVGVV